MIVGAEAVLRKAIKHLRNRRSVIGRLSVDVAVDLPVDERVFPST